MGVFPCSVHPIRVRIRVRVRLEVSGLGVWVFQCSVHLPDAQLADALRLGGLVPGSRLAGEGTMARKDGNSPRQWHLAHATGAADHFAAAATVPHLS